MKGYLGLDVGSVSTNVVLLGEDGKPLDNVYLPTRGRPIEAVKEGLGAIRDRWGRVEVMGAGTTGSGRKLAAAFIGADAVKNEITAHAVAALDSVPGVQTVLEIGGQDSKIIVIRQGIVVDFAMNTLCAAGTGSFLDRQASRLDIPIERFGDLALASERPVRIAGRCAVFAESDMVHKQQTGHSQADIVRGLCQALVRNYLNNVAKGKEVLEPVVFQGGVASNAGMKRSFEEALGLEVTVPPLHKVMGAIGAAILAMEAISKGKATAFKGFHVTGLNSFTRGFECGGCSNDCEIVDIYTEGQLAARWGGRCGKWQERLSEIPTGNRSTVAYK